MVGDSGMSVMEARLMRAAVGLTGLDFWAPDSCGVDPRRFMLASWPLASSSLGGRPSAALSQSPLSLRLSICAAGACVTHQTVLKAVLADAIGLVRATSGACVTH